MGLDGQDWAPPSSFSTRREPHRGSPTRLLADGGAWGPCSFLVGTCPQGQALRRTRLPDRLPAGLAALAGAHGGLIGPKGEVFITPGIFLVCK